MPTPIDWITETTRNLPALVTAAEASAVLRTTPRNLRRHIVAGRIKAIRAEESGSSRVLVPRAEIERFLRVCAGFDTNTPVERVRLAPVRRAK